MSLLKLRATWVGVAIVACAVILNVINGAQPGIASPKGTNTIFLPLVSKGGSTSPLPGPTPSPSPSPVPPTATERFIAVAKSPADFDALRDEMLRLGGKIVQEMPEVDSIVVLGSSDFKAKVAASAYAQGIAKDQIRLLVNSAMREEMLGQAGPQRIRIDLHGIFEKHEVNPDPAFALDGLMWNVLRIRAPEAWKISTGTSAIKVAVVDTGLDFTHSELKDQVSDVVDLTVTEDPPICKTYYSLPPSFPSSSMSDADLAAFYGAPATTDFNGHGTWIGGNIAAALDGAGINGIAPNVKLVSLKISQWCNAAYDSTIIDAIRYAANHDIDIVNISFSGYLDRSDPASDLIYQQYATAVAYARGKGTLIVGSAGDQHIRIGAGGLVLSHGSITNPGAEVADLYGWWQVPGGIPGVIDVSATNNVVGVPSDTCPAGTTGSLATCKPQSDAHQPFGAGKQNQLAYYSNYGPRIDIAGPGGARKFNLLGADRGGTPGWPVTQDDPYKAYEDFGITSNWGIQIPCLTNLGAAFPQNQCYTLLQGPSMAAPHVAATGALIVSRLALTRNKPDLITFVLKTGAQPISGNETPELSATDTTPGDLNGIPCPGGYCHLGGPAISDREAYGVGLVDALTLRGLPIDW